MSKDEIEEIIRFLKNRHVHRKEDLLSGVMSGFMKKHYAESFPDGLDGTKRVQLADTLCYALEEIYYVE